MAALLRDAGFGAIKERLIDDMIEVPADRPVWKGSVERTYDDRLRLHAYLGTGTAPPTVTPRGNSAPDIRAR